MRKEESTSNMKTKGFGMANRMKLEHFHDPGHENCLFIISNCNKDLTNLYLY